MAAKSKFTAATLAELGPAKLAELIVEEAQANPAFRKRVIAALAGTQGPEAVAKLHFPGLSGELAQFLVTERKVAAVGLDTPSLDYGQSKDFIVHRILLGANIPGFENVANLEQLPPRGAMVVALPIKIRGGSGAPLRIVALVP